MEDFYKVSENINGVTTWVSYSKAIWYGRPMANGWVIGDLRDIGTGTGGIYSYGSIGRRFSCPYEATNDIVFFNDKNILEPDISKDISIQCMRDPPPPPQSPLQGNLNNRIFSFVPEH